MRVGRYDIIDTHWQKVLFPAIGLTKEELANYYVAFWEREQRFYRDRPIVMLRFVKGIKHEPFYHKNVTESVPSFVRRVSIETRSGSSLQAIVAHNAATLAYLTHLDCITPHVWLSSTTNLDRPDQLIFDLDPWTEQLFSQVVTVAQELRDLLEADGLTPFVKLTGSRGLHVVVPIRRTVTFEKSRAYAHHVAEQIVNRNSKYVTLAQRLADRKNKVYIDVLRNSYGATAVAPYAVRARANAPVAMPIAWKLLDDNTVRSDMVSCRDAAAWLAEHHDPWQDFFTSARALVSME